MGVMTIDANCLLGLLEEVGRNRALTERETDLVEEIVMLESVAFRWSARLDLSLNRAAQLPGGIARFARRHNISPMSAYQRLARLRKRQGRQIAQYRREG